MVGMEVCGRYFTPATIERIQRIVDEEASVSRLALSRQVCEWLDWRAPNGRLQDMSCRKALAELDRRGVLALPECTSVYAFQQPSSRPAEPLPELPEVKVPLRELGAVEVIPVSSRYSKASGLWKGLMDEYHYLGSGPLCGAQIRYLVRSDAYGWLGGLSFSGATWRLNAREEWIGWGERARRAHLHQVVCNSRFLILPSVEVRNLASHVLSLTVGRLAEDWHGRYAYEPVLVETFVDPEYFTGACYRAANWTPVGRTAGLARPYPNGKQNTGPKDIYVYALRDDWQSILCEEPPPPPLGSRPGPANPTDWVEEEFGRVDLPDRRLKERVFTVARDFFAQPGALVPQACNGSEAKTAGAYRLFKNEQVDLSTLLRSHVETTVERIREHPVVLSVQDTTTLNYTAHPRAQGLGPINTTQDNAVGLVVHDTMAFTPDEGVPLGLVDVQCWVRNPNEAGKSEKRKSLPIEEKESFKWLKSYRAAAQVQALCPETMVVSVGDREADLYELFAEAQQTEGGPELLVRAEETRNRQVNGVPLWKKMQGKRIVGYQVVHIPGKQGRPARAAKLALRYGKVKLKAPGTKTHLPSVTVWVVYAQEVEYAAHVDKPVEWMLLTTVDTNTFEQACERIQWYARRWGIEVYHRTFKSGCRIEDRRLSTADRMEACLAIDLVIAWRIYLLTKQGRETPDLPCDVFLSEEEWRALYAYVKRKRPPAEPPSLRDAVRMIASLGGFLGRKCDGEPGTTAMWRGLVRLGDITAGSTLLDLLHPTRAGP